MTPSVSRMIFVLAALLLPVVVIVTSKLPTALLVILALAVLAVRRPRAWRPAMPYLVIFCLLIGWAVASAIWSIDPAYSFWRSVRLAATVACGLVLCMAAWEMEPEERNGTATFACIGLFLGVAIALLDGLWWRIPQVLIAGEEAAQRPLLFTHLPASCVFALLLFPAVSVLIGRRRFVSAAVLATVTVASVIVSGTTSAALAIAVGAAVFVAVRLGGTVTLRILLVAIPVLFLVMPMLVQWSDLPKRSADAGITLGVSTAHRLVIWRFVNERIAERPVLGWGFHSSRMISGGEAKAEADAGYDDIFAVSGLSPKSEVKMLPLHPHNASFHLRLELGLVGLVLYAAIYLLALHGILRLNEDATARAGAAACVAAAFVIGQISFSVWQSWWVATQFWVAALVVAALAANGSGSRRSRPASLCGTTSMAPIRAFR